MSALMAKSTDTPSPPAAPNHQAPAVARAIGVLKLLARERQPMGVNAIARGLDVVPSSCLHILRALAEDGLVQVDPRSKQYSLGLGLLTNDFVIYNNVTGALLYDANGNGAGAAVQIATIGVGLAMTNTEFVVI